MIYVFLNNPAPLPLSSRIIYSSQVSSKMNGFFSPYHVFVTVFVTVKVVVNKSCSSDPHLNRLRWSHKNFSSFFLSETYLEPRETSMMEHFTKIVKPFQELLWRFLKLNIGIWQGPKYISCLSHFILQVWIPGWNDSPTNSRYHQEYCSWVRYVSLLTCPSNETLVQSL